MIRLIVFIYLVCFAFVELKAQSNVNSKLVYRDSRVRDYITPAAIVWKSDTTGEYIKNAENLLNSGNGQADLSKTNLCILKNSKEHHASIIFDFGKEIHGGLQIVTDMFPNKLGEKVHLRFGESLSETISEVIPEAGAATNEHAMRDFEITLPWLGKLDIGNTGFRFVRIDLLSNNAQLNLKEFNGIFIYRDIPYLGSFTCNDSLLNRIWQTGAYTVHLNMQEYLWDGIKRDRLVWVGDLHPEIKTINSVFGYNEVVPKSLDLIRDITPVEEWMNGITSYSMWWVIIHKDWYLNNGDLEYLKQQREYLLALLEKFASMVGEDGKEQLTGRRFLDWPSSPYPEAIDAGYHALLKMTLEAGVLLSFELEEDETAKLCQNKAALMEKVVPDHVDSKQAAALLALANSISEKEANAVIEKDGAQRFSTFYGYYMLLAMAKADNYSGALEIIKAYWGGMLQLGATTFWEDFNIEWMENAGRIDEMPKEGSVDVHATYGDYCYQGLRHSFCHGWASGPTAWLSEHVLGIKVLEPGCKKIAIEPNLGNLQWVEGTYPTPQGLIKVRHEKQANGKIISDLTVPAGIEVVE
ncbi:alpha-L-rhamnosidase-related protein [Draconibacterium sediminis]|uniref:Alpha-L-rhamnosidase n=1 Tax=Draconibacterium sediminis TaxID=1544798 RepID=A0A0D8J9S7_9BACT|nr:alpha-L-rhamnosidase C-terminal domain-containing protein [Draconibacterium sediminis]KJF43499.1 alpha-L-rhamnosidase [Draconibacterium sediminis]